jgi:mRNA degradation ribonuclease J1/J2
MDATRKLIQETIWNSEGDLLQEDLQQALKAFFYNETKRRPMIFVTLSRA